MHWRHCKFVTLMNASVELCQPIAGWPPEKKSVHVNFGRIHFGSIFRRYCNTERLSKVINVGRTKCWKVWIQRSYILDIWESDFYPKYGGFSRIKLSRDDSTSHRSGSTRNISDRSKETLAILRINSVVQTHIKRWWKQRHFVNWRCEVVKVLKSSRNRTIRFYFWNCVFWCFKTI